MLVVYALNIGVGKPMEFGVFRFWVELEVCKVGKMWLLRIKGQQYRVLKHIVLLHTSCTLIIRVKKFGISHYFFVEGRGRSVSFENSRANKG